MREAVSVESRTCDLCLSAWFECLEQEGKKQWPKNRERKKGCMDMYRGPEIYTDGRFYCFWHFPVLQYWFTVTRHHTGGSVVNITGVYVQCIPFSSISIGKGKDKEQKRQMVQMAFTSQGMGKKKIHT